MGDPDTYLQGKLYGPSATALTLVSQIQSTGTTDAFQILVQRPNGSGYDANVEALGVDNEGSLTLLGGIVRTGKGFEFVKGPSNPLGGVYSYHLFDGCGDVSANSPFWQGCQIAGPALDGVVYPRLSLYWDTDTLSNPTYIRGSVTADNANSATLRLGSASGLVEVDGDLSVINGRVQTGGTLEFQKGPSNPLVGVDSYHLFDTCGDVTTNSPFWQGCQFAGPALAIGGSGPDTWPRLSVYWDVDALANTTYVKGTIRAGNASSGHESLFSLHLGSDSGLVQVDGTLNATDQIEVNGTKAIDGTGTASQSYYAP